MAEVMNYQLRIGLVILLFILVFIATGAKCSWKDKKVITGSSWSDNWFFIPSTPDTPTPRADHTAIWTDNEMIIWGGYNGTALAAGAKYYQTPEPGGWVTYTSSWTPLASTEAPSARYGHTTVWDDTNKEMIIWGGYNNSVYFYTGARYNPSTDAWNPLSTSSLDASFARTDHTAVWTTGNKMLVWGGQNILGYLHTGGKYDPLGSWEPITTTDVPWPRQSHTAVWTGTEMVVWGGSHLPSGYAFKSGGIYAPNTDTWTVTNLTGAPLPRDGHTAVWTGSEMIIWGGYGEDYGYEKVYLDTGARYAPSTKTWTSTTITDAPFARSGHTAIWTGPNPATPTIHNKMIIWGGRDAEYAFDTGAIYSIDTWSAMTTTNPCPDAQYHHTAIWTGTEMIIWGGQDIYTIKSNTGGRYDPSIDIWSTVTPTELSPRTDHTAIWTGPSVTPTLNNKMLIWGGLAYDAEDTGSRYDPVADAWTPITLTINTPTARYCHTAIWTGSSITPALMIIWGGYDGTDALNTGGRYDLSSDTWEPITTTGAPSARYNHTAIWDNANNRMIIWGGYNASSERVFDTGAAYYPITNTWSAIKDASEPLSARKEHTAVWTGNQMLVWGGFDGDNPLGTGAKYNLTTWTPITTTGAPSTRTYHTAVWATTTNEMLIWGGWNGTNALSTGARYDLSNWTPITTTGAPAARHHHTAFWTGTEMYIWGGLNTSGQPLSTGAKYNPSSDSWTALPTSPVATGRHTAIWTGTEMIIWGGWNGSNYINIGALYKP